ncbi:MAG: cytochrome b/b6 domain-containing protein, partial [Acetobacteraceae bacterium]
MSGADDRIRLSEWLPPHDGVVPRIRWGRRWINVLWAVPIVIVVLILGVALTQWLRTIPGVQAFIRHYPGTTSAAAAVHSGFPLWLRLLHFFNLFFMMFIIRAGIQILADHPRLYWRRDCTPGTEWFRFQTDVPRDRVWTSKDDSVTTPGWLGIPGVRHSIGLARWWHFSFDLLWVITGVMFYVLLFTTDQWRRLVPDSWSVFPNALSTALQYWSLNFPPEHSWTNYNALQQLTYFITVFLAAPLAVASGLMQGPAIANRMGWFGRVFNRQAARTVHFGVLCWFLFFIFVHTALVFMTGARQNLNYMFAGVDNASWTGALIYGLVLIVVIAAWWIASPFTIRHARVVQRVGQAVVGPLMTVAELGAPKNQYTEQDISPYLWLNGTLPNSAAFAALLAGGFADYTLRVGGLVEHPRTFTYAELKGMPRQEQITEHFCIQGWSGVA